MADGISKYANQFAKLGKSKDKKVQDKTENEMQSKPHAETKTDHEVITQTESENKQETKKEEEPKQQVELETEKIEEENMFVDPALKVLSRIEQGQKKKKMEDERVRRTYWLLPEEIKMVNDLSKLTGDNKYDVVGTAIRSMYERAMQVKKNKKPDQR